MLAFATLLTLSLISNEASLISSNRYTELVNYNSELTNFNTEYEKISEFLYEINEINRLVFDSCESLEERSTLLTTNTKPSCRYNISYINNSEINVFEINDTIRKFVTDEKKYYCKKEQIECGELTIILKLIDLVNYATSLAIKTNNTKDLWNNLKIMDFYELKNVYKLSLNNFEFLSNITLHKHKANMLLNSEREKIRKLYSKKSNIIRTIGNGFSDIFSFIGNSCGKVIGSFISSTASQITPVVSTEYKILFFALISAIIYSKVR